jgi:hypothetical protein
MTVFCRYGPRSRICYRSGPAAETRSLRLINARLRLVNPRFVFGMVGAQVCRLRNNTGSLAMFAAMAVPRILVRLPMVKSTLIRSVYWWYGHAAVWGA